MAKKETEAEKKIRQKKEREKIFADFKRLNKEKPFNTKESDTGSDSEKTKTIDKRGKRQKNDLSKFKSNPVFKIPPPTVNIEDLKGPGTKMESTPEEKKQFKKYSRILKKKKDNKPLTNTEQDFLRNFFKQNLSNGGKVIGKKNGGKVYSRGSRKAKYNG